MESRESGWGNNMKSQISDSADNQAGDLLVIYSCLFYATPLSPLFLYWFRLQKLSRVSFCVSRQHVEHEKYI